MSLLRILKQNLSIIGVWYIDETLKELIKKSKGRSILHLSTEKRKKEFLATRLILEIISPQTKIIYNKYGAPEIDNKKFISISHSNKMVAVIISDKKVGLDIEKISEKAVKISSKFILKIKHNNLSKDKATLIWCCKEAIYKWYQKGNIDFKHDIDIHPLSEADSGIIAATFKEKKYSLNYIKLETYFLVYVCK